MKMLFFPIVLVLTTLTVPPTFGAPNVFNGSTAERHEEFVVGPFHSEHHAHEAAHDWRERGFHAEVFRGDFGWHVRVWRGR